MTIKEQYALLKREQEQVLIRLASKSPAQTQTMTSSSEELIIAFMNKQMQKDDLFMLREEKQMPVNSGTTPPKKAPTAVAPATPQPSVIVHIPPTPVVLNGEEV